MNPALVLVDLQHDFLARPHLAPTPELLIQRASELLNRFREHGLPVYHVHTMTSADGENRMPHWKRKDLKACIRGTAGAETAPALRPEADEIVIEKAFFSAFGNPTFETSLSEAGIDTLVVAGIYLHGCVRSTVLDAYERGFETIIVDDAVGSTEPLHAALTRRFLIERSSRFLTRQEVTTLLGFTDDLDSASYEHRSPRDWSVVREIYQLASPIDVDAAARRAEVVAAPPADQRKRILENWAARLKDERESLALLMADEIGKPVSEARSEVDRAVAHVQEACRIIPDDAGERLAPGIMLHHRPHGVVGLITPWNNPVAIPVGKIAPALALGNCCVWKAAPEAPETARRVHALLAEGCESPEIVELLIGDGRAARAVVEHPLVKAVSVTGSTATGQTAAATCLAEGKPLQAEMGGLNAVIILPGADLEETARGVVRGAFSFAGQRCTALRRILVHRDLCAAFEDHLADALSKLRLADPRNDASEVGPVISRSHQRWIEGLVATELANGAERIGPSRALPDEKGCWVAPAILTKVSADSRLLQEEVFGPIAVMLPTDGITSALEIANGTRYGLVAGLIGGSAEDRESFEAAIEAGVLQLGSGPVPISAAAPFSGWKQSAFGPPEHGRWDRDFYSKTQVIYRPEGHER